MRSLAQLFSIIVIFVAGSLPGQAQPSRRLALLIGCPFSGEETTIQNDVASFRQALHERGFEPGQIKELVGDVTRAEVLHALHHLSETVAGWHTGEVFLYYTGHGGFSGTTADTARPALMLSPDRMFYWDEVFSALRLPPHVQLILLPDC